MAGIKQNKQGGGNPSKKSRWKPVDGRPAYHAKTVYSGLTMSLQSPAEWVFDEMTEKLYPEYPLPLSLADMDPGKTMTLAAAKIMHLVFATVWHAGSQRILLPKKVAGRFIASKASAISSKDVKAAVQRLAEKQVIISACGILGGKNRPREISLFSSVKDHSRFDFEFVVSDEVWEIFQSPKMWTYIGLDTIHKFKSVNGLCLYTAFCGLLELRKRRKDLHKFSVLKHLQDFDKKTGKQLYPKAQRHWQTNLLNVPLLDLATWVGMRETAGGTEPKRIHKRIIDVCDGYIRSHGHIKDDPDVFGIYPGFLYDRETLKPRKTIATAEGVMEFQFTEPNRPIEYQRMSSETKQWYILKTVCADLRVPPTSFQLALKKAGIEDGYQHAQRIHDEWKHYIWKQRDTYPGDKPGSEHIRDFADILAERRSLEYPPAEEMKLAEAHWQWLEGKRPRPEEDTVETLIKDSDEDIVVPEFPELPEVQEPDEMEAFNIEFMGLRRSPFEHNKVLRDVDGERQYLHDGALDTIRVRLEVIPFLTSDEVGAIAQR